MTTGTLSAESEIRLPTADTYDLENLLTLDVLLRVAVFTVNQRMLSRTGKSCLRMIERVLVEQHRLRIAT
jgi:hypothetical protein